MGKKILKSFYFLFFVPYHQILNFISFNYYLNYPGKYMFFLKNLQHHYFFLFRFKQLHWNILNISKRAQEEQKKDFLAHKKKKFILVISWINNK